MTRSQKWLDIQARCFCESMGREYAPIGHRGYAPVGAWFVRRMDTETAYFVISEQSESGGISHPITETGMTAKGLADALYFARMALGVKRADEREVVA